MVRVDVRREIVAAARRWVGTPFAHQARAPGVGLDCIGLVVCAARAAGLDVDDCRTYKRRPNPRQLLGHLSAQAVRSSRRDDPLAVESDVDAASCADVGDVLAFWFLRPSLPRHLGIVTERGLLHTSLELGRVVEHPLDREWRGRAHSAWTVRGVE